jgi:hypothetical protein
LTLGRLFNFRNVLEKGIKFVEFGNAEILVGDFTTVEDKDDLHQIFVLQEVSGLAGLGFQIVLFNTNAQTNGFGFGFLGGALLLLFLLLEIVKVVLKVHHLADRRIGHGGHLDEIQRLGLGALERFGNGQFDLLFPFDQ